MKKIKTKTWDTAEFLNSEAEIEEYLNVTVESGDPKLIVKALGNAARAYGMLKIAKKTKLGRESLYKSLSGKSEPKFSTITKVADSLGYTVSFKPKTRTQSVAA